MILSLGNVYYTVFYYSVHDKTTKLIKEVYCQLP